MGNMNIKPESVDVAVWAENDGDLGSRRDHGGPIDLYRWISNDSPLPDGYYRIFASPTPFLSSRKLDGIQFGFVDEIDGTVEIESQLGEWTVPVDWKRFGELYIRILKIDAPPTGSVSGELASGLWHCPWSPDRWCHYCVEEDPLLDYCVFCGHPDERQ